MTCVCVRACACMCVWCGRACERVVCVNRSSCCAHTTGAHMHACESGAASDIRIFLIDRYVLLTVCAYEHTSKREAHVLQTVAVIH